MSELNQTYTRGNHVTVWVTVQALLSFRNIQLYRNLISQFQNLSCDLCIYSNRSKSA